MKRLSISWKYKVLFLPVFMTLTSILSIYLMLDAINNTESNLTSATDRSIENSLSLREADGKIRDLNLAINNLILLDDKTEIRQAMVETIKLSSEVEEGLVKLKEKMPNEAGVVELFDLFMEIKPIRLKIIKVSRKNNDEEALLLSSGIQPIVEDISNLTASLIDKENTALKQTLADNKAMMSEVKFDIALCILSGCLIIYLFVIYLF